MRQTAQEDDTARDAKRGRTHMTDTVANVGRCGMDNTARDAKRGRTYMTDTAANVGRCGICLTLKARGVGASAVGYRLGPTDVFIAVDTDYVYSTTLLCFRGLQQYQHA